jgi:hypothetical protein
MPRSSTNPKDQSLTIRLPAEAKAQLRELYPTLGMSQIVRKLVEDHLRRASALNQTLIHILEDHD